MSHDYSDFQEKPAQEQVELLGRLVQALAQAQQEQAKAESEAEAAKSRIRKLRENDIPELMLSMGMKSLSTAAGLDVVLREEVRASLPKDAARREAAFQWLRDNGHAGLIKHEITLKFNKTQDALAQEVYELLEAFSNEGAPLNMARKDDVHHQTLLAFLREELRQGTGVPLDRFGAFIQKFAEVKEGGKS